MDEKDLLAAIIKRARNFQDRVPVFRITQPSAKESVERARVLALAIWNPVLRCLLFPETVGVLQTRMQLPNNGRVDVFQASGSVSASMKAPQNRKPFDPKTDRSMLKGKAQQVAETIAKSYIGEADELRFESLWELNAQGVTLTGEKTTTALFEVVSAFRRYLRGLPVFGRASIHVGLGPGPQVTRWGMEWRPVGPDPFVHTPVISPEEGAKRVMDEMAWRRPERPFTAKDFEVKDFMLGYMSLSRRVQQFVMQPVWVAVLAPLVPNSMAHVVAVPAAPQAFEPIARPARVAPLLHR